MNQLNAEPVNDPKQRGRGQKVKGPSLMSFEQPKQAGALRQVGEQCPAVVHQPAVEGSIADPLQGVQQTQRDDFARPQQRLGMFSTVGHGIVYPAKQLGDKVHRDHVTEDGCGKPQELGVPTWPPHSRLGLN